MKHEEPESMDHISKLEQKGQRTTVSEEPHTEQESEAEDYESGVAMKEMAVPKDFESLSTMLEPFFYSQDDPSLVEAKHLFLVNMNNAGPELTSAIKNNPDEFDVLFYELSQKHLSPEVLRTVAHNYEQRQLELSIDKEEQRVRVSTSPLATDKEYRLGVYAEALESQVRDAVFVLLDKGYTPLESGYMNLDDGSQYLGINGGAFDPQTLLESITGGAPSEAKSLLENQLKYTYIQHFKDSEQIQLILVPNDPEMSKSEWKTIWDLIARCAPETDDKTEDSNIDNGLQGVAFRKMQDELRKGVAS